MKNSDLRKFIQENYKLIIPIVLMFVLFISFLVYYLVSRSNNYQIDEEVKVYQYFYGDKYEYTAVVSKNKKEEIIDYKVKDLDINLDSTPIYYQKKDIVILPEDMSVVMPTLSCAEYLSKGYFYITFENEMYTLTTNNYDKRLNHYFLYDGRDLYFFIEPVTLVVDDKKIELSSFSYVSAKYNGDISYYDKKNDKFGTIVDKDNNAMIENDYYKVNISNDIIDYQGMNVILTSGLEHLNTIDMKD